MQNKINKERQLISTLKKLIIDNTDNDIVIITHTKEDARTVNSAIYSAHYQIIYTKTQHKPVEINYVLDPQTIDQFICKLAFIVRRFDPTDKGTPVENSYCSTNVIVEYWRKYYKNIVEITVDGHINSLGYIGMSDLKGPFVVQLDKNGDWITRYRCEDELDEELQKRTDELEADTAARSDTTVTIGTPYCGGQMCNKRETCKYHVYDATNDKVMREHHDYSMEGSGTYDSTGYAGVEYMCGNHGKFKMYEPVESESKETKSDTNKSIEFPKIKVRQPGMPGGKFVCSECEGDNFEYALDDDGNLVIRCCWCDTTSKILIKNRHATMWKNFKETVDYCQMFTDSFSTSMLYKLLNKIENDERLK